MDALACPYDKTFPLRLLVIKRTEHPERQYIWRTSSRRPPPSSPRRCSTKASRLGWGSSPSRHPGETCRRRFAA